MYPTSDDVAAVLAVMLTRSGQSRARVSGLAVRHIARRSQLRSAFVVELANSLSDLFGIQIVELDSGGFALIKISALEAAKAISGKKLLTAKERKAFDSGQTDFSPYFAEMGDDG